MIALIADDIRKMEIAGETHLLVTAHVRGRELTIARKEGEGGVHGFLAFAEQEIKRKADSFDAIKTWLYGKAPIYLRSDIDTGEPFAPEGNKNNG